MGEHDMSILYYCNKLLRHNTMVRYCDKPKTQRAHVWSEHCSVAGVCGDGDGGGGGGGAPAD